MYNTTTKDRIKNALLTLMSAKDFSRITIKDICEQAEISRSSYYRYYYAQEDVLHDIFDGLLSEIVDSVDAQADFLGDLHRVLLFGVYQIRRMKEPLKIILTNSCETDFMHIWNSRWQAMCDRSFLNANEQKEYREWYADFVFFGIYSIYRKWILSDCRISEERLCKVLEKALQSLLLSDVPADI